MSDALIYCPECAERQKEIHPWFGGCIGGDDEKDYCPVCESKNIIINNTTVENFITLLQISPNPDFIRTMIEMKENDVVEFELKMSQFRYQVHQQEIEQEIENNKPTCPRCGSKVIVNSRKGFGLFTGFFGASDFRYECLNCHQKWKPNSISEDITRLLNGR